MTKSIVVVDYHKGNLSSVERGLARAGAQVVVTDDPRVIAEADALVLPGVGAFFDAMEYMRASGQAQAVRAAIARGVPFLGICLGLQLLYERGVEGVGADTPDFPWTEGLGVLKGSVVRFESRELKVPHVGWNQVHATQVGAACPLLEGVPQDAHMYFTHSYAVDPVTADACDVAATTDYVLNFPCVAWRGNVFGCQFHPEKSSSAGQVILRNFVKLVYGEDERGMGFAAGAAKGEGAVCAEHSVPEGGNAMILFPAIDLIAGKVVRLERGDRSRMTVYAEDPAAVAAEFVAQGAQWIHVVDLSAAFEEDEAACAANRAAIEAICQVPGMKVDVGGGVRSIARIEELAEAGASRIALGTAVVRDPAFAQEAAKVYGGLLVADVAAKDGVVKVNGWREGVGLSADELVARLADLGFEHLVFTDIARDGMQTGVDATAYEHIARVAGFPVVASGGIAALSDIEALAAAEAGAIEGCITGRALYEGAFTLADALAAAHGEGGSSC